MVSVAMGVVVWKLKRLLENLKPTLRLVFSLQHSKGLYAQSPLKGWPTLLSGLMWIRKHCKKNWVKTSCPTHFHRLIEDFTEQNRMSQITGSLISSVRDAFRTGLLDWSPRLMLAMYSCEIQASSMFSIRSPVDYH